MRSKDKIELLIIAELDGDLSMDDKARLEAWISETETNREYYEQIKESWKGSLDKAAKMAQTSNEWKRFCDRISVHPLSKPNKVKRFYWYQIAAIAIVGLFIAGLVYQHFYVNEESSFCTFISPEGSVNQVILPDSSVVYLNSGSQIKYDVKTSNDLREVFLNGEAWFHVKKNKHKPFIVHTSCYNVKVLGTKFNVNSYSDEEAVTTTLEEGSVQVLEAEKNNTKGKIILKPGEQLTYDKKNKIITRKKVNTKLYTSWRKNELVFSEMKLGELVKLLERKYGVEIEVKDSTLLESHFSGTIKNESISELLGIIQYTHPITYQINGNKVIINKK